MVNFKIIFRILGGLLYLEATLMLLCMGLALYFGEDDILLFAVSGIMTMLGGVTLRFLGRDANNRLSRRDSYLLVTLLWVVYSLFASLPFLLGGYLNNFTDAYFEAISGFTTTGATVIDDVEALPHGILFWRSLTQWVGGVGIVFSTLALIPSLAGGGSIKVFRAETTGLVTSKLHPKLSTNVRWIWFVYIFISVACFGCYMLFGMDWFEAVNYAMSASATGGYSINNTPTEYFNSPAIEYTTTFFCFLSGINFTLLYSLLLRGRVKAVLRNTELRFYIAVVALVTVSVMAALVLRNGYGLEHAFRSSVFQVVSFVTTTGLLNDDISLWPRVTWLVLGLCMVVGACSGSTTGGMKCVRIVMLFKVMRNELVQRLHPNAVLPLKINDVNVPDRQRVSLLAFVTAYIMLFLVMVVAMIAMGLDNTNAVTVCVSSLGNVGPSLGIGIGQPMSWSQLPCLAKWLCAFMMLVGRLEIFSVLVVLTPSFWTRN